jgi:hypothetical protein
MNNPANTPEPMPVNRDDNQPVLWDLVIEDFDKKFFGDNKIKNQIIELMHDRDNFGFQKYGVRLKNKNGRSFFNDVFSELLDGACYAKGLAREQEIVDDDLEEIYMNILKSLVLLYEWKWEHNG